MKRITAVFFMTLLVSCSAYKIGESYVNAKVKRDGLFFHNLKLNELTLNYWDSESAKPIIVLLHGVGSHAQLQWYKQLSVLKKEYRVIMPNLLWFGGSRSDSSVYTIDDQVKAMSALLDTLHVDTFSLCGISYGALVAAELASMKKGKIKKLVLVDAPVKFVKQKEFNAFCMQQGASSASELFAPREYKKIRNLMACAFEHPPSLPNFVLSDIYQKSFVPQLEQQRAAIDNLENNFTFYSQKSYSFACPVLLVWGENDEIFPSNIGEDLKTYIGANAQLKIIPKTKHMPNLENPKLFNKTLKEFLD